MNVGHGFEPAVGGSRVPALPKEWLGGARVALLRSEKPYNSQARDGVLTRYPARSSAGPASVYSFASIRGRRTCHSPGASQIRRARTARSVSFFRALRNGGAWLPLKHPGRRNGTVVRTSTEFDILAVLGCCSPATRSRRVASSVTLGGSRVVPDPSRH